MLDAGRDCRSLRDHTITASAGPHNQWHCCCLRDHIQFSYTYIHTLYSQKPVLTPESSCVPPAATISPYLLDDVDLAGMVEPAAAAVAEQKKKASEAKQA
jgi:hypothetical protein